MIITRQDGVVIECTKITLQDKVIYYTPKKKIEEKKKWRVYMKTENVQQKYFRK